jgi:hypothetical protein
MALEKAFDEIIKKRVAGRLLSNQCAYKSLYDTLSEADQKTLDEAWEKNYPVNLIVQALRSEGHKCSSDTIRVHRNGTCRCQKE